MIYTQGSRGGLARWYRLPALLLLAFLLAGGMFLSINTGGQAHAATQVKGSTIASIAEGQRGGTCSQYYGCPYPGNGVRNFPNGCGVRPGWMSPA